MPIDPTRAGGYLSGQSNRIDPTRATQNRRSFRQRHPRHPAEVTADRLAAALDKWPDRFDASDRDAVAQIRHILNDIAEEAGKW